MLDLIKSYVGKQTDFRVQLFNILAIAGAVLCIYTAIVSLNSGWIRTTLSLVTAVLSVASIALVARAKRREIFFVITVVLVFFCFLPSLFFTNGGTDGSLVFVLILGVLFTVILLRGRKALFFGGGLILWYCGIFACEYNHPEWFTRFDNLQARLIDMTAGFFVVSTTLMLCVFFLLRLYDKQQETLAQQNEMLQQNIKLKTEFIANASHETKTPLTVVSVNVQQAAQLLEEGAVTQAKQLLQSTQEEVIRLARQVDGMLRLSAMREINRKVKVDYGSLLALCAEQWRIALSKSGNSLVVNIPSSLAPVYGDADSLAQLVANLLKNASEHTKFGRITVSAEQSGALIVTTIADTGSGIAPQLLPRVFERGVSGGGTGYGLHLCKVIVESHGGDISIQSECGKGTTVTVTFPVYAGQLGDETI